MKTKLLVILFVTFAALAAHAQQFDVLHNFVQSLNNPVTELLDGGDGFFYGTTATGGPNNKGSIFKTNASGEVTIIHLFAGPEGAEPQGTLIRGQDELLYGTTSAGGAADKGTVFALDALGNVTTLYSFSGDDGSSPRAGLIQASDGMLYGSTIFGGGGSGLGSGTIFKISTAGSFTSLHSFAGTDGAWPIAALIQGSDGNFYGTTYIGGANGSGTVFRMAASGNISTLHHFAGAPSDGSSPYAPLTEGSDKNLYGSAQFGGTTDNGMVFKVETPGTATPVFSPLYSFSGGTGNGANPTSGLLEASDGKFYGTTRIGGAAGKGTIFRIDASGILTTLRSFQGSPSEGSSPFAGLIEAEAGTFYGMTWSGGPSNHGTVFKFTLPGTFTTLHAFAGEGTQPTAALVQANDGNLYGLTTTGGATDGGTIFKIGFPTQVTTLHSLIGSNGRFTANTQLTDGTLIEGSDGNLYGATWAGGSGDRGTLFKLDLSGTLTTLYSFTGTNDEFPAGTPTDGANPDGALVEDSEGNFYGLTARGGAAPLGLGTVFKRDSSGTVTTLHSFTGVVVGGVGNPAEGSIPSGALIQGGDGNFYGTTILGGMSGAFGTVFKMDALGVVTTLYSFLGHTDTSVDGSFPEAGVFEANDDYFYGTTTAGGTHDSGVVFKVDRLGNYALVHTFVNTDGSVPKSELIQGSDGNLYGTTSHGGFGSRELFPLDGHGTVFKIDPSGTLTTLHSFSGTDGSDPRARLFQANDGHLYGTTVAGGSSGAGVVFRIVLTPPKITSITRLQDGRIVLQCLGVPNQPYVVQASPDLVAAFTRLPDGDVTAGGSGAFDYVDFDAGSFEKRFYRLALP